MAARMTSSPWMRSAPDQAFRLGAGNETAHLLYRDTIPGRDSAVDEGAQVTTSFTNKGIPAPERIDTGRLRAFIQQVFEKSGMASTDAGIQHRRRGIRHEQGPGVRRPEDTLGQVIGYRVMRRVIDTARTTGVSAAVVRNTTSIGALGAHRRTRRRLDVLDAGRSPADTSRPQGVSMLLAAIDPTASMPYETFTARADGLIDRIHGSGPMDGAESYGCLASAPHKPFRSAAPRASNCPRPC